MPKKIAIIYSGAKYFGGVETYLLQLFENVDNKKINLILISLGEWELTNRLKNSNKKVVIFNKNWWNIFNYFEISSYLSKNEFNLIVTQGLVSNFYGKFVSLFSRIPSVITVHSDYKFDYPNWKKYIYFITFRPLDFLTKKYITVSDFLNKELTKMGISPKKITIIYNGVEDIGVQEKKAESKIVLGSLGRLHYKKGYSNLIKAISELKNYDIELKIWGEGEEKNNLLKLIHNLNLTDNVKLMGFTKNIKSALKSIDIYIQPSFEEGFGLTVIEASLAEKPIIVTPAGSLPELIINGKNGIITNGFQSNDIAESIEKLLKNKENLKMAKEARKIALEKFNINNWTNKLTEFYIEACR